MEDTTTKQTEFQSTDEALDGVKEKLEEKIDASEVQGDGNDAESKEESTEATPEETPEETKTEEKQDAKVEEKEEKPVLDEKATQELTNKVADAVAQRLVGKSLDKVKEDSEEKPVWEKEKRNPTYKELADYLTENAKKGVLNELDEREQKVQEEENKRVEAQKRWQEEQNNAWDDQLEDLVALGKLPKIENPKDKNDIGVKARQDIQMQLLNHIKKLRSEGKDQNINLSLIKFATSEHYKPYSAQPAGADAPVGESSKGVETDTGSGLSYEEMHSASIEDILERANKG